MKEKLKKITIICFILMCVFSIVSIPILISVPESHFFILLFIGISFTVLVGLIGVLFSE